MAAPSSDSDTPDTRPRCPGHRCAARASTSGATSNSPHPSEIVTEARRWIGTPFHHQASLCGTGTDCLGLIRGIWRALYGDEPEPTPAYAPDWAEATASETLLAAARRNLIEAPPDTPQPGDVLLFRLRPGGPVRHCGIAARHSVTGHPTLIHAWSGHRVAEVPFAPPWQRRLSHVFRFPDPS